MKYFGKLLLAGILIGLVIAFVLIGFQVLGGREIVWNSQFAIEIGYYLFYSIVLTFINSTFFDYLNKKVVWKKYKNYRILIGAAGSIVLTMLGLVFIRAFLEIAVEGNTWNTFAANQRFGDYVYSLLVTAVVSIFFHAVYFYKSWQENKVKEHKIIAGTASAQFDALKNQLDPHFLFNSLNVLTSLIEEDPHQAQKFTTSLSKVYRYVLEQKNKDLVFVDEELKFAKTYMRLLKMRFEDSIVLELPDNASNPEAKIVPLSLQLLLENAVKHNVVTAKKPLHIKVFESADKLVVSNNLQEKQVVNKSSGVGLRNIRQRYGLLSSKEVLIEKTATDFSIQLPMLTKQVSVMETQQDYIKDKRYQRAKQKVEKIKGFYGNLTSYCIVIPVLIFINIRSTSDFPWAIFPALGWGFGVIAHGMEAFGYNPLFGKGWEAKKMDEYMNDDNF